MIMLVCTRSRRKPNLSISVATPPLTITSALGDGLITLSRDDFDLATFQTQLASVSS
jgi:hypothetical protein